MSLRWVSRPRFPKRLLCCFFVGFFFLRIFFVPQLLNSYSSRGATWNRLLRSVLLPLHGRARGERNSPPSFSLLCISITLLPDKVEFLVLLRGVGHSRTVRERMIMPNDLLHARNVNPRPASSRSPSHARCVASRSLRIRRRASAEMIYFRSERGARSRSPVRQSGPDRVAWSLQAPACWSARSIIAFQRASGKPFYLTQPNESWFGSSIRALAKRSAAVTGRTGHRQQSNSHKNERGLTGELHVAAHHGEAGEDIVHRFIRHGACVNGSGIVLGQHRRLEWRHLVARRRSTASGSAVASPIRLHRGRHRGG